MNEIQSNQFNKIITEFKERVRTLERRVYLWQYAAYFIFISGIILGIMIHEIGVKIWSL
jgi:hypothetical protein